MSFEKRKADAFLTVKRKKTIKQLMTHEELVSEMLKNPEVLAEYELNKSTGAVQRVDNDRRSWST